MPRCPNRPLAVEAILGEAGAPVLAGEGVPVAVPIQPDTFVGLNIAEAASEYLRIMGRGAKSTEQIADGLNRGGLNCTRASVSTILRRNNNEDGVIIRVGDGPWGRQDWYPGRPKRTRQIENEE